MVSLCIFGIVQDWYCLIDIFLSGVVLLHVRSLLAHCICHLFTCTLVLHVHTWYLFTCMLAICVHACMCASSIKFELVTHER